MKRFNIISAVLLMMATVPCAYGMLTLRRITPQSVGFVAPKLNRLSITSRAFAAKKDEWPTWTEINELAAKHGGYIGAAGYKARESKRYDLACFSSTLAAIISGEGAVTYLWIGDSPSAALLSSVTCASIYSYRLLNKKLKRVNRQLEAIDNALTADI